MNLTGDFGAYVVQGPILAIGETLNRTIPVVLPLNESLGPHHVGFFVSWDYQNMFGGQWNYGSNFWSNSTLTVVSRPSTSPGTTNPMLNPPWLTGLLGI